MSTSFLVIQAQRDLAQAKTNELARGARLRPVARRLRGAAAGGTGGTGVGAGEHRFHGTGPDLAAANGGCSHRHPLPGRAACRACRKDSNESSRLNVGRVGQVGRCAP